jgi:hypothetical protein
MPYVKRLGAGLFLGALGAWVHVRFVEALEHDFLRVSLVPPANFHSSIAQYSSCVVRDHCQVRGLKTGA